MGWPVCCYAIKLKLLFALSVEIALGLAVLFFVVVVVSEERNDCRPGKLRRYLSRMSVTLP